MSRSAVLVGAAASGLFAVSVPALSHADRSVVVTQIEERAFFSLWLLSDHAQQSFSHAMIQDAHDVSAVEVFSDETLAGVDVCYISPSYDELVLSDAEVDALEKFAFEGGRLIIPSDYGMWAAGFGPIAERFDVFYGKGVINESVVANADDHDNPILNGPEGIVDSITGAAINDDLHSANPNFRVLATWEAGPISMGYLEHGEGDVVFLSDDNAWDNDMLFDADNLIMWLNLFALPECLGDFDGDGLVGSGDLIVLLGSWGDCEECPGDINGDGNVGTADLLELLGAWGACP